MDFRDQYNYWIYTFFILIIGSISTPVLLHHDQIKFNFLNQLITKLHNQRIVAQKLSFCVVVTVISLAFHRIVRKLRSLNDNFKLTINVFLQILDFIRSSKTYASILSSHCDDTQIVDVSCAQIFSKIHELFYNICLRLKFFSKLTFLIFSNICNFR